ncbi:MAG: tRNA (N6-isopentenyl adenosine(37)-C2)-methylthiotransferase MiaB [Bacteriovoracaceae bacterium]|nr:tRNA (N6-isopentenyl adenosine(37)-C2)-methylthiotransferase MiaB [Bacteriovoracaceae bacterium]
MENINIVKGDITFPPRKVWFKTFGCQMNYHDTERMLALLTGLNFTKTELREEADLVLFNTCAIRGLANEKFYSQLGEIKHLKAKNPALAVGAAGCVSQIEGNELLKKYKHLDFAFGTDVIDQISEIVYRFYAGESKFFINAWDKSSNYSIETKITHNDPRAFVNIIKGCNNFCTYCIVPFTRGREISRKIKEIVEDVKKLVNEQGIREITLLGQNVNSFGKENDESIAQLIHQLDKIDELKLIRYTSSHPYNVSDELIKTHGSSKKLALHLHLPVQSGSDSVLTRMKRRHTRQHYLDILKKLREANPEIVLSSDIIVGFPNETEEEYQDTLRLLDEAKFDFIYAYKYSSRPGTKAADIEDSLPEEVKKKRLVDLQKYQLDVQTVIRQGLIGKIVSGLVEEARTKDGVKKWVVRTSCFRIVHFEPENPEVDYKFHWVDLELLSATQLSFQGKMVKDHGKW